MRSEGPTRVIQSVRGKRHKKIYGKAGIFLLLKGAAKLDRNASKQIREEIQEETGREKMEHQLKEAIVKYTEGEQTIDEVMYSLLHQSSQIGARLRQKSKKFIFGNFDIKVRYVKFID